MLALLLARAGTAVPIDELVDELWGERPPASAFANARMYAANLRRIFATMTDGPVLARSGAGYALAVDPGDFDVARFRDLTRQARQAMVAGDPSGATSRFTEAVGLWRGPAIADVPVGPILTGWRVAVEEERLTALEDLGAALVAAGDPTQAVARAREVIDTHPLRERGHAVVMRALQAAGDVVGALAAFDVARQALVDQLGIEPGEELNRLRESIADRKRPPAPARQVSSDVVPRQLPADIISFTGRVAPLRRLDTLLPGDDGTTSATVVISAIAGTAGVGKTALAVHWAYLVRDRFPDGQLYVNLRGFDPAGSPMDPSEALRGFLDALSVPSRRIPSSLDARVGLYRSLLAGRRMLVVLDNARNAEQVRPLLPGASGCLALVTSRNQLAGLVAAEGAQLLALDVLTTEEARQMLARRIGAERIAAEPEAVDEIIVRCVRLPLALAVAAARAAVMPTVPLATLANEVRDAGTRLDALDAGDATTNIRAVFSWSYRTLSSAAARLFRLLGLHPGPDVSAPAAASLAGLSLERTRMLLTELIRAHLLTEPVPGRYVLHDLLRVYAAEQARTQDSDAERTGATRRLFDHYLHTAHTAAMLLHSYREPLTLAPLETGTVTGDLADQAEALAWFTVERPVLMAAIRQAEKGELDTYAWQLAWTLTTFCQRHGHWDDQVEAQGLALTAAQRLGDKSAQTHAHRSLARIYGRTSRFDEAHDHLVQALELLSELGDTVGQAHAHYDRAVQYEFQHLPRRALEEMRRAFDLYRAAGRRSSGATALNGMGWFHALLGEYREALECSERALGTQQELGNRTDQADCLANLGYIHLGLGNHRDAVRCHESALALYRDVGGDRFSEAQILRHLGDAYQAGGDRSAARTVWEQALEIFEELGNPQVGEVREKLGELAASGPKGD